MTGCSRHEKLNDALGPRDMVPTADGGRVPLPHRSLRPRVLPAEEDWTAPVPNPPPDRQRNSRREPDSPELDCDERGIS